MTNKLFNFTIFKHLLQAKLVNIRSEVTERIINIYIWAACTIFVTGYVMQSFGLAQNFGVFQFAGILATVGLFELYGNTATLIADFEGDRKIAYYLALPTSAPSVMASYVAHWVIHSVSECLALVPLGICMLFGQLNFMSIAWGKLLFFIVLSNTLWAVMAFVLAAYLPNIDKLGVAWCRVIFPLWFLGGFQFSWSAMLGVTPALAYIMLANPMVYGTEGVRAVILGQQGYIPFWLCCTFLAALCVVMMLWAGAALRKRLDFV
jgi:ABC-2 type transport system permease protein